MPPINVRSWESLRKKLKEIAKRRSRQAGARIFLFRGIHDSTLPLATTLERVGLVSEEQNQRVLQDDFPCQGTD